MPSRTFRVYLAGPEVFLPDAVGKGEILKGICRRYGVEGLYPMDNAIEGLSGRRLAEAIRTANMELIARCDAVVANMAPFRGTAMDPGTAYEMGVAAGMTMAASLGLASGCGKLVVGYTGDRRDYLARVSEAMPVRRAADGHWRDADGLSVEDFGLVDNLMMACGAAIILPSFEQAIAYAARRLASDVRGDGPREIPAIRLVPELADVALEAAQEAEAPRQQAA